VNRRRFLASLLAAGLYARAGRLLAAAPAARRVAIGILLDPESPEGRGARLGIEEARRVGDLLHVEIASGPSSDFALVGVEPPRDTGAALFLSAGGEEAAKRPVWNTASSPAFRRQALSRHPDRHDLRAADWHAGLMKFGAEELNVRFLRRFGGPMDERAWHGWIAVKCAVEIALRYPGGSPKERISELRLDGHKGMMLRFDPQDRHLVQPVYLLDAGGRLVEAVEPEWKED
jgi:hypothetical protein